MEKYYPGIFPPLVTTPAVGATPPPGIDFNRGPSNIISERLQANIGLLPPKVAMVVYAYYFQEKTLAEIGKELHYTRERIRQLKDRGITMLRHRLCKKLPYPQPRVYGAVANSGADPKIGPGDNNEVNR